MAWIAVATTAAVVNGGLSYLGASQQADAAQYAADQQAGAARDANKLQWDIFNTNRTDLAPWRNVGQGGLYSLADLMGIDVPMGGAAPGSAPVANQPPAFTPTLNPAYAPVNNLLAPSSGGSSYMPRSTNFGMLTRPFTMQDLQSNMDPGYGFRVNEGLNALNKSAAARGGFFSGNTGIALQNYGQDMASNELANAYNRWRQYGDTLYNRYAGLSGTGQTATNNLASLGQNTASSIGQNSLASAYAMGQGATGAANAWGNFYGNMNNNIMGGIGTYANYNMMNNLLNKTSAPASTPFNYTGGAWDAGGIY